MHMAKRNNIGQAISRGLLVEGCTDMRMKRLTEITYWARAGRCTPGRTSLILQIVTDVAVKLLVLAILGECVKGHNILTYRFVAVIHDLLITCFFLAFVFTFHSGWAITCTGTQQLGIAAM